MDVAVKVFRRLREAGVVESLIVAGGDFGWISQYVGFGAVVLAMINVVGGYAVTNRMLSMFRKDPEGS